MITATPFLAAAADAKLEDWGGWAGTWQIHETIRKLYVLF
jgi:uncharacterized cupin superfamily protein